MSFAQIASDLGTTALVLGVLLCLRFYGSVSATVQNPLNRNIGLGLMAIGLALLAIAAVM